MIKSTTRCAVTSLICALLIFHTAHAKGRVNEKTSDWYPSSYTTTLCGGVLAVLFFVVAREKLNLSKIKTQDPFKQRQRKRNGKSVKVLYGTQTGNAKILSEKLAAELDALDYDVEMVNLKHVEPEECLLGQVKAKGLCIFIVSTYVDGSAPDEATWFYDWLKDTYADFRVHKYYLQGLDYAIYGLGDSAYGDSYNKVAKDMDFWLSKLHATPAVPLCLNDESHDEGKYGTGKFPAWKDDIVAYLKGTPLITTQPSEPRPASEGMAYESSSDEGEPELIDLEDLGNVRGTAKLKEQESKTAKGGEARRDMLTPLLRQSLGKQGYRLIGSHSGVKLCRWTKAMLRGRGGCYKHSFYGIDSHRCMEATPSLACANKCVFCWRHHTNPVGTEWKWNMDTPEMIVENALKNHYKMINEFKGVPGVLRERLNEGLQARHCALSLVGEPIMYPKIGQLVRLLHDRGISTFLVTNAQFPDALRELGPVTQLYVSVDASSREALKRIDRPLFPDFWQRFQDSLATLADKGQRTVYRLTLVKEWNMDEMQGYANLVGLGKPDFIEIKGVTYCGESKGAHLTMTNVPWHEEVLCFVKQLVALLPDYSIASEHEHSNCVLVAHNKFCVNGQWNTWIDYERFHKLVQRFYQTGESFTSLDYVAPLPHWAVFGARERGFDPNDTRMLRRSKKDISGC
ncbi:S-adenosyl-L-methionine-dependent tRNA 4-demethylwyosine synthase TYW1-like isoform X1 [Dermacentor albipictus]|uniref:S-adenosyl-L-methionine-dependent tRNA 4-demethylwyosine synthase TYW1-like isoform X1 n=1 Tax=Dermacentor albipictus TaxID=60249 RepID=UPI0031FDED7E